MARPLDPWQYVLWHRLRRSGRLAFIGGMGAVLTTIAILLFQAAVTIVLLHDHWSLRTAGRLALVIAPLCAGAFAWTWSYMERRYRATLAVRCPTCGYRMTGLAGGRCPECGALRPGPSGS